MRHEKSFRATCMILLVFFALATNAQNRVVTGKITDAKDGSAVQSATIEGKDAPAFRTLTDATGAFSISIGPAVRALVVTAVGFAAVEIPVEGKTNVEVVLAGSATFLNEVVVTGYGSSRRKDLTGSITAITAKDFQTGVITSPDQLVAGKIPGVSIISNSGQPGSGSTIRIRGGSSLSASNDPLFVIDGVPLDNSEITGAGNPLSFINPNDIESITVLKDASAAAIYGTRASNGVILIITKKGKSGALKVNFSTLNSVSDIRKKVDVLTADEFRAVVNAKGNQERIDMMGTANTDWQDEIYRTAFSSTNNLSLSGGLGKLPYRVSFGYQDQNGIIRNDELKKTSIALVLNPNFFDNHLKVDINVKASTEKARFAPDGVIGGATSFDPTQPVRSKSARFGGYYEWLDTTATGLRALAGRNPVGIIEQSVNKGNPKRSIGNIQFDYKFHFLPELHANLNLGYDVAVGRSSNFTPDSAASAYLAGGLGGSFTEAKRTKKNKLLEFYLNYVKDLKSIHSRIDATAGYSYNNYVVKIYNFPRYYANGSKVPNSDPDFPYDKPENTLIAFFGRLNYSFQDRYLVTGTIRRDASSRFAPNNRWGLFPSVAVAWKIKDEPFLRNSSTFSGLKLRVGYGVTGQQDGIGNYDYLSYYALSTPGASYQFGDDFYQGFRPGGFYANRKWEETATTNAGLDFGFMDNRITGSVDFYVKKTRDLLNSVPQPAGTNFSAFIVANVGDMKNRGVEFSITAQPVRQKDLVWNASYNITYNKNTITNLTVVPDDPNYPGFPSGQIQGGIGGQFVFINAVGSPKNTFNLYKQVYDADGNPIEGLFVDKNGDGIINQNDLFKGKSGDPKVFMGFSTDVTYKRWYAGFVLRASFDNYVDNNNYSQTGVLAQITGNAVLYNASANYLETGFIGNSQELLSDYYVQNGSFLKMDNLNIGYNAGKFYNNKVSLRVSATIQNVFVITNYKGIDPELASGIDNNLYPRPRIYSLGINLDF